MLHGHSLLICPQCAAEVALEADGPWSGPALACQACGWRPPRQDGYALFAPALAAAGSDYNPAGFDALLAAEHWHFWFAPRARLMSALIARHFPAARSFLEVGCGTGYVTGVIAQGRDWARLAGCEISADGLAHAARLLPPAVELMQMDARALPFRDAFDVIGCFDVLEHIIEDEAVLKAFTAALTPGGGVVLAVPQHMWLWSAADDHAQHKRRYARGELQERCRAAGLEVLESFSYNSVTLPLMLASRLIPRQGVREGSATDELNPPRWINAMLRTALQAEVSLTLAGLHLPVGGSRVVVARKRAA
ncbi:MAG: class I SAM-dependent methyltransferase [Roseococcus sp.]